MSENKQPSRVSVAGLLLAAVILVAAAIEGTDIKVNYAGDANVTNANFFGTLAALVISNRDSLVWGNGQRPVFSETNLGRLIWPSNLWDDVAVNGLAVAKNPSDNPPDLATLTNGLMLLSFSEDEHGWTSIQVPHWARVGVAGAEARPHIHWTSLSAPAGDSNIVWHMEWAAARATNGNYVTGSGSAYASSFVTGVVEEIGWHSISGFGLLSVSNPAIWHASTVILMRIHRTTDGTQAGEIGLISVDWHFQRHSFGSKTEFGD